MKLKSMRIVGFCLLLSGLAVGSASAANLRYHGDGDWMNASNWTNMDTQTSGTLPNTNFQARVNWNNTVTLSNAAPAVQNLQIGVDAGGTLNIEDGGYITSTAWSSVGNNGGASGTMNVYSNGLADFPSHLWVGFQSPSTGYINIYDGGVVKVGQMLGAGWSGGTGYITVNSGGVLELAQLHGDGDTSFKQGSTLNITGTGQVTLPASYTNIVDNYVANGHILGNGIPSNTITEIDIDGGITNLVIKALVAVPNVIGISYENAVLAIEDLEYQVGNVYTSYLFGAVSGSVIGQDPVGGTDLGAGSSINLTNQEALASTQVTVDWIKTGPSHDWMNQSNWKSNNVTGVLPYKETQNYKVRTYNESDIVLTNLAAVNWLVMGDGGNTNGNSLLIDDGGYLSSGWSTWTAIGYSRSVTATVKTNAVFENKQGVLFAWDSKNDGDGGVSYLNIDGGTFIGADHFSFGGVGKANAATCYGVVTVDGEGVFDVNRFTWNNTNCVVRMNNGTLLLNSNKTNDVNTMVADGRIEIAPGTTVTLDYDTINVGRTTLRVVVPGFASWAGGWGVDIGSATNDYDDDLRDNLYEYALNGDPTDGLDPGHEPVFINNGGVMEYIHLSRADDTNLVYTVQTKTDLVNGGEWMDVGSVVTGTDITGDSYDVVTNMIPTTADQTFIRLKVVNP